MSTLNSHCVNTRKQAGKGMVLCLLALLIQGCQLADSEPQVSLTHGVDASAGSLPAYIVTTENATYYLEKSGGGLSSLLDQDGIDWIGFNNIKGSGWKGEYRGFPNAVHQQDGNYFHAMNGEPILPPVTSPSTHRIMYVLSLRQKIENGKANGISTPPAATLP